MAAGEIFAALQSGTLDAAEFVGPYNDLALGFYQIAKNYYFPSFVEPGLATEVTVNKAKFQALPEDLQAIVRTACAGRLRRRGVGHVCQRSAGTATLVSEHGVQVRRFPDEILEAGAKAAAELLTDIRTNGDALTKEVAESFVAAFNLLRTRTEGTDMPFLVAREKYFKLSLSARPTRDASGPGAIRAVCFASVVDERSAARWRSCGKRKSTASPITCRTTNGHDALVDHAGRHLGRRDAAQVEQREAEGRGQEAGLEVHADRDAEPDRIDAERPAGSAR